MNLNPEDVCYITYTGKAAQVLRSKGCHNAKTSHKLLYKSVRLDDGTYRHFPRKFLESPYRLIIVDEVSMLPKPIWDLLLSHQIPVLALGDPGQLPPVRAADNGVLDHPHIFLDEIMRQAAESEIIQLTMSIRDGKPLELLKGNEVRIVDQDELDQPGFWHWADQILVGKNNTRFGINTLMRRLLYQAEDPNPIEGDRIICLKNNWNCVNSTGDALVNGASGFISNIKISHKNPFVERSIIADFIPDADDDGPFPSLEMDAQIFTEHHISPNKINPKMWIPQNAAPEQFDFGYAITCHKSQGSEYEKVLVLEEFLKAESKEDHIRWLYTAATRASKKLIIVRNYRL